MMATDEDALICDVAETYHVLDIGALDVRLAATLAAGLAPDSRIMRKLRGQKPEDPLRLLAILADEAATIRWFLSTDGKENTNRPPSYLAMLDGGAAAGNDPGGLTFATPEAFEAYRAQLIGD